MAKSRMYVPSLRTQKSAIKDALEQHFGEYKFDCIAGQSFADRDWIKFYANRIKVKYADLTMEELAHLVEYQIIDFLEDIQPGHRFEAVVKINPPDDFGWYWVYADISVLREDY